MTSILATVVIPSYNAEADIETVLQALDRQTIRDRLETLVVDNGSTDATLAIAGQFADRTALLADQRGSGPARSEGLRLTATPLMLSLDADCTPAADWAERHLDRMEAEPRTTLASAGRTVPRPSEDPWAQRADITPHPGFESDQPLYAVAGNACYRTDALRQLGGFPSLGADDAALGVLARQQGYCFVWTPDAVVEHRNPSGWRGYVRQMRKIGAYAIEVDGPPRSRVGFWLGQTRWVPSLARHTAAGRRHEAVALALAVSGKAMGARDAWRRGRSLKAAPPKS
jgi:cellulose synthase/poly-beta-1,6-N-acetylglucosamine synthase-like glycosyltransferase